MINHLNSIELIKRGWFTTILICLLNLGVLAQGSSAYSIYAPPDFPTETLSDFIKLLESATNQSWTYQPNEKNVTKGIILRIANNSSFTSKESYRLESNGRNLMKLSSSSTEGLVFGFYKHLRSLGYKFYLPDELYTITPTVTNPFGPEKDMIDKPFLQVRDFFGTGGFGSGNSDKDRSVQKDWILWKIRNGFGSAYQLAGHRGENFILENRETLQKHPDWLVSPLTGNDQNDKSIKLNYLNKKAVEFYADWTINPLTRNSYKLPPQGYSDFVSIEPSDGGGFLNELPQNAGKKLPSISDQVYSAANLAAQKLDRLFPNNPNIGVNLYAYSGHAEPPTFKLHPRVFVQLIPYQFQTVAFGPSFIKLWAVKASRFGLYDYLNYPDSRFDLPGGLTLDEAMKRLVHSVKSGSEGTSYETSYSKFATGIPLWILCRYMTEGDSNWEKNLNTITGDLFKNAKEPVREIFSRFYNSSFGVDDLGTTASLVEKASKLTGDPMTIQRINELKQYLYFIHLVYQSRDLKNGSFRERMIPVAEFAWKLYETKIIHSYRIMQLVSYAFLNIDRSTPDYSAYQQLHIEWFPETEPSKSAWGKIKQFRQGADSDNYMQVLKRTYSQSPARPVFTWTEVLKAISQKYKPQSSLIFGGSSSTRGYFGIYSAKPSEIKIRFKITSGTDPKITISGIDNNYQSPQVYTSDKTNGELKFKIPAGETTFFINTSPGTDYRMQVKTDNGYFFFDGSPRGLMAFYKDFSDPFEKYSYDPQYYPSHIFIPKDAGTINYKVQLNALAITSPSGKKISSDLTLTEHGGFETRRFRVDPAESGKIWKAVISGNYNYNFLNMPDRYFLLEEK